jgi:hypothetical protein
VHRNGYVVSRDANGAGLEMKCGGARTELWCPQVHTASERRPAAALLLWPSNGTSCECCSAQVGMTGACSRDVACQR